MNLQHVNVKIFVDGELTVDLEEIIKVFHRWVADQSMDELLIDVADYRHVPGGPGVVLIGHQADYSMDNTGHRFGLRYNRKAPVAGSDEDRFRQAFLAAAKACRLLEAEFADLKFSRRQFQLFINDRELAPNTPETLEECLPIIEFFLTNFLGERDFSVQPNSDPRQLFGVEVTVSLPFRLEG